MSRVAEVLGMSRSQLQALKAKPSLRMTRGGMLAHAFRAAQASRMALVS